MTRIVTEMVIWSLLPFEEACFYLSTEKCQILLPDAAQLQNEGKGKPSCQRYSDPILRRVVIKMVSILCLFLFSIFWSMLVFFLMGS